MSSIKIPEAAIEQVRSIYGPPAATSLDHGPTRVELPHYATEVANKRTMGFYYFEAANPNARTMLYVPGMLEVGINKVPTAAEFAKQGMNFILTDQDRGPMLVNPDTHKEDATYTQAMNMLAVYRHCKYTGTNAPDGRPIDLLGHSIGGFAIQRMLHIAEQNGELDLFKDSRVVLLAPGGMRKDESLRRIFSGWFDMMKSEMNPAIQTFPPLAGTSVADSLQTMRENPKRAWLELRDLARLKVDPKYIADRVDSLAILIYGEDLMFPMDGYQEAIDETWSVNQTGETGEQVAESPTIRWLSPLVNLGVVGFLGKIGTTHDFEQFVPYSVAINVKHLMDQRDAELAKRPFIVTKGSLLTLFAQDV